MSRFESSDHFEGNTPATIKTRADEGSQGIDYFDTGFLVLTHWVVRFGGSVVHLPFGFTSPRPFRASDGSGAADIAAAKTLDTGGRSPNLEGLKIGIGCKGFFGSRLSFWFFLKHQPKFPNPVVRDS